MLLSPKKIQAKNRPAKVAYHMAEVLQSVDKLLELHALQINGNTIFIYKELLQAAFDQKAYVKNLYLYMRAKQLIKQGQSLYIKSLESSNIIAQYTNEKALLFL